MNFKHPLFYTGIFLLLFEIICLILMPKANSSETLNQVNAAQDYVPFMFFALTGSFIAAFLFLFGGIVFILKASLKENIPAFAALLLAFLTPMLVYYTQI